MMKFKLSDQEIVQLSGKKEFAGQYLKAVQDYYYDVRNGYTGIWEFLEIQEVRA